MFTPTEIAPLVERLRTDVLWHQRRGNDTIAKDCQDAADEIERLYKLLAEQDAAIRVLKTDLAREREECAMVCERLAAEEHSEMLKQPEGSPARDRYFARQEALRGAATEVRLGA